MGMAPYGEPRFVDKIEKLIRVERDGSFRLNMDYFSYHFSPTKAFNSKFEQLFGPPRKPESYFFTSSSGYPSYFGEVPSNFNALAQQNEYYADIAASIQVVTEEILLKMVHALHRETGQRRLCMAGGVALNSVANGRLLKETPFEELYIQPAAGDSGAALGAALYAHHVLLGQPRRFVMEHAYWGKISTATRFKIVLRERISARKNLATTKSYWIVSPTCSAKAKSPVGFKVSSNGDRALLGTGAF